MCRELKNTNRYKGLTLAEVVTASALLIIVMVPILKALTTAQVSAAIIEQKTHSLILAQAKLDDIKARSIYSFDTNFSKNNVYLDSEYLCQVVENSGGSDLKQITVKVGYDTDSNGSLSSSEIQITLVTLFARRH